MEHLSCAFFGHRDYDYGPYEDKIKKRIVDLINRGVTQFYSGNRGRFDRICAQIVRDLQDKYPHIKNTMALSYISDEKFEKPAIFDDTVYLLEKRVSRKYAISHTNKMLVQTVDYVISSVVWKWGGAKSACDYAEKLYKMVFYIVGDNSYCDNYWLQEEMKRQLTDKQICDDIEKKSQQLYEKIAPQVEANIAKFKK